MPVNKTASYTKPELRDRIKSRVMASGDGGKPGQWSARKAQLVAQKYESAGGGYSGAKTEGQKSLSKWTDQKWTTSDGKPAERKGGTTRYLPEKAWDKLSPSERSATNAKKREGSREGEQFVKNTEAAAEARKEAVYKLASDSGAWQRSEGKNPEGGLNAKGRASLKAQGHDIKPGVKGPADTPEKMKRKGSFLSRMFGPGAPGAMKKDNGEPSRRALSAKAWGEPVPSDDAGRARLYAKGQSLLKRYSGKEKEAAWDFPKRVAKDLYMGFQNPIEAFSALPKNVRLSLTAATRSDKLRELARDAAQATGAAAGAAGRLGAAYVVGEKLYNLLPSQAEPAQVLEEDHGVKTGLAHFKLSNAPGFPVEALREAMEARQGAPVSNQVLTDALHSAAQAKARAHTPLPQIFAPQPRSFWGESPAQFAGAVALPIAAYGLHRAYKYFNPDRPAVKTAAFNAVLQAYGLEKDAFSFSDTWRGLRDKIKTLGNRLPHTPVPPVPSAPKTTLPPLHDFFNVPQHPAPSVHPTLPVTPAQMAHVPGATLPNLPPTQAMHQPAPQSFTPQAPRASQRDYENISGVKNINMGVGGMLAASPEGAFIHKDPKLRKMFDNAWQGHGIEEADALAHQLMQHQAAGGQMNAMQARLLMRRPEYAQMVQHMKTGARRHDAKTALAHYGLLR